MFNELKGVIVEKSADLTLQALEEAIKRYNEEAPENLRLAARFEQLDSRDSVRLHGLSKQFVLFPDFTDTNIVYILC